MLGLIKTLGKYLLLGLLLAGVGLGLGLFVWWMGWPLFSVAVVVGGAALLVLLFMAARQLRVWFNKQRYVHHVLTTDPSLLTPETRQSDPLSVSRAWERGMAVFTKSPRGRRENPVHTQPWVIQLGNRGCLTDDSPKSGSDSLNWHFLPDLVLLELDETFLAPAPTPEQQSAWELLLSRLLETRSGKGGLGSGKAPEALLATVDVRTLGSEDTEDTASRARRLHARLRELQTLFEARIPLYVTVTGLETLPGMAGLLDTLSAPQRAALLGERFPLPDEEHAAPLSSEACAARAVEQAERTLRRNLLARAAEGFPPDGDELLAVSGLRSLEQGLTAFLAPLFRLTPHVAAPLLRGIVFIAGNAPQSTFIFETESSTPFSAPSSAPFTTPVAAAPRTTAPSFGEPVPVTLPDPSADARPAPLSMAPAAVSQSSPAAPDLPVPVLPAPHKAAPHLPSAPKPRRAAGTCFTADLLSRVLPAERAIRQGEGMSALHQRLSGMAVGCWYLAMFVACGLIAATTVYNWNTLRNAPGPDAVAANASAARSETDAAFQRLQYFEEAQRRWWLPTLGLDRIGVEREAASARYLADMRLGLPTALSAITNSGTAPFAGQGKNAATAADSTRQLELMQRLLWLSEAVDLRRTKGSTTSLRGQPFPASGNGAEDLWSIGFGDAFLNYLDRENVDALPPLTASLRNSLQQVLGRNETLMFQRLAEYVNLNLAHKAVSLSEFWPNVPRGSNAFLAVPPVYTAAGFADLSQRMTRLYPETVSGKSAADPLDAYQEAFTAKPFWKQYLADYAAAWQTFALNSDRAWNSENTLSTLDNLTAETDLIKTPSARLLTRMARELQPLAGPDAPAWVNDVFLLNAMVEIVALTGETDPGEKLGTLSILLGTLKTSGPALAQVRDYLVETRDARSVFRAIAALREYEQSLQELRRTQLSPEGAYTLAAMHYGGKQYGDAAQSACTLGEAQLAEVFRMLHVRPEVGRARPGQTQPPALSPAAAVLRGQLRLAMHGVVSEAALELQRQWESGVLSITTLTPMNPGPLFGDQGVVKKFLDERAAPFLDRKVGSYLSRVWDNQAFPFTEDFLQFAQQGHMASLVTPRESYEVRLRSQTSSVNPEARERLQFVELTLTGPEGSTVLKNQNYPVEKVFTYKPGTSGAVSLRLNFPTLTLSKDYPDFVDFLHEFAYGERVFSPQDFPESTERMEFLNISRIVVRLLPANAGEVLAAEAVAPMPLPERIAKVW